MKRHVILAGLFTSALACRGSNLGVACRLESVQTDKGAFAAAVTSNDLLTFPAFEQVRIVPTCIELEKTHIRVTSAGPFTSGSIIDEIRSPTDELKNHGDLRDLVRIEQFIVAADRTAVDVSFRAETCSSLSRNPIGMRECLSWNEAKSAVTASYACRLATSRTVDRCRASFRPPGWLY